MNTILPPRGACQWQRTTHHAFATGSRRRLGEVTCCNCKTRVQYSDSYVTVPMGHHGRALPLPVFVHCAACMIRLDATDAWQHAYGLDKQASQPDPEKVERERVLNDIYGVDTRPADPHVEVGEGKAGIWKG